MTMVQRDTSTTGGLVEIDGEQWYRIDGADHLAPFLMSVVSDGDRWMFVSSGGSLTAGRRDANQALFPYVTDDRLHAAAGHTGPVTLLRVDGGSVWEPFAPVPVDGIRRSVAKTVVSDSVRFEERHEQLGLVFAYRWSSAEEYGFVRTSTLCNDGSTGVEVDVLDGIADVLPWGLEPVVYQRLGNLANAYKRSELVDPTLGLAVYSLESPVSDRAEPEEVLRATTVWSSGPDGEIDLDRAAVTAFRADAAHHPSRLVTGVPGAHLRRARVQLEPGASISWYLVADVGRDQLDVTALRRRIAAMTDVGAELANATRRTAERVADIIDLADAQQHTGDALASAHHVSNVIYNVMRGGVPLDGYSVDTDDLAAFVRSRNRHVADRNADWFETLDPGIGRNDLLEAVRGRGDVHLERLVDEYLPFSFSRRHGDPSRPWNQFSIRVVDDDGAPLRYYEGNWRDVFQNWEALCASFPEFLPGIVSTFVNASTADGYNPYRITRDGIDWEAPDPDDPWANIGYWGDHQIVYLLRLLLQTDAYFPGLVANRLDRRICTYADVPYRIAPYPELVVDAKSTIEYDTEAAELAERRVAEVGGDGRLLRGPDGELVLASLAEKLLVTALTKLSNFVPGGGIWMNTQRPEWNDANNALVGSGLSMVTLFHLRRFVDHVGDLVRARPGDAPLELSVEVAAWMRATTEALGVEPVTADGERSDRDRRALLDRLGSAASDYRTQLYRAGFSGETTAVDADAVSELCDRARAHLDATIARARRPDGLVHSYNLLRFPDDEHAVVEHLPAMLEGQVAALTPGLLPPAEQADLVEALYDSDLYRHDLDTFVLAPPQRPPAFLEKNTIDPGELRDNELLGELLAAGDGAVVESDTAGTVRFAPDLTTLERLVAELDRLGDTARWSDAVERCRERTVATYERVFGHHGHIGRSGAMYGYEGIGSVYWHMVTKLLLGVQEASFAAQRAGDADATRRLVSAYARIRAGLGVNMTPEQFGAVPIDPYSHSPAHAGAQQPGMTGAVKEEILARPAELGVVVDGGRIVFDPLLLRADDLLVRDETWSLRAADGRTVEVRLASGSLGLTVCQVPVVVSTTDGEPWIEVEHADGRTTFVAADRLDPATSAAIFARAGDVRLVRAGVRVAATDQKSRSTSR